MAQVPALSPQVAASGMYNTDQRCPACITKPRWHRFWQPLHRGSADLQREGFTKEHACGFSAPEIGGSPPSRTLCSSPSPPYHHRHFNHHWPRNPTGGARTDYTHVIVMDGFLDDVTRQRLLDFLTEPGWTGPEPPLTNWERATCDSAPAMEMDTPGGNLGA